MAPLYHYEKAVATARRCIQYLKREPYQEPADCSRTRTASGRQAFTGVRAGALVRRPRFEICSRGQTLFFACFLPLAATEWRPWISISYIMNAPSADIRPADAANGLPSGLSQPINYLPKCDTSL